MFEENPLHRIEQIDQMRLGVDYRLEIKVRGFSMFVRPICIAETIQIAAKVQELLNTIPANARNRVTEHVILAKETLKLASTSDVGKEDWKITDIILDAMTPDELQFLYKQYVSATDKANPAMEQMTDSELHELQEHVKKNPDQLIECSFFQLLNLVRSLLKPDV